MIAIEDLKGFYQGICIVVAHGTTVNSFPWEKVKHIPKIQVNFYDPSHNNVQGVICWDKDILNDVYDSINDPKNVTLGKPLIYYSGTVMDRPYQCFLDPETFPPGSNQKIFTGPRAIYLSQYLGYNKVYLVGFDFVPHSYNNDDAYLVQKNEVNHFEQSTKDITQALQVQLDSFKQVEYIHQNIYQTNQASKLNMFEYKLPEEIK